MSGASQMGVIGVRKQEPEVDRKLAAFAIQSNPAHSTIASNARLRDAHETFRQKWQAIVRGLDPSEETRGDDGSAAESLRGAGSVIAGKEPVAVAANKGRALKDSVAFTTGGFIPDGASGARSTAQSHVIVLQTSPVPDKTRGDSDRLPAKGRADDSISHATASSRASDQFVARKQITDATITTTTASCSEVVILEPIMPHPGIPRATEDVPQPKFAAPESLDQKASLPGHQAVDVAGSATGAAPSSNMGWRQSGTTAAGVTSEGYTAPEAVSSQHAPEPPTDQAPDDREPVSTQKPTVGVAQARPLMPYNSSLRLAVGRQSSEVFASENFTEPSEIREFTLDRGAQIKQPVTVPLKKGTVQSDQARIGEGPLNSPAKTAMDPSILNRPASDAGSAAFGQTRGEPLPSSAPVWTASSPSFDASAVTTGKTALVHETFAAMDAGRSDGAAKWILADSHRAEAGFQDPSLGWIGVRAQTGAAGIHAALMPGSEAAAEILSGHLAGLNAHMAHHYEHMNAITVATPDTGWNSHDTGRDLAHGEGRGRSDDGQQQAQEHSGSAPPEPVRQFTNGILDEPTSTEPPVFTVGLNPREHHISVMV